MNKKLLNFIDKLGERLFSNTYQMQRIVMLTGIVLVVATASFAGYYYYDRYYRPQPKIAEMGIAQAEQAVRDDPNNPEKRLNLAETYMVNRRIDDALKLANEVMVNYPENQHAWLLVGVASNLNSQYQDAIPPLEKFLEANKDAEMPGLNKALQSAAFYLGDSYLKLNQYDKAVVVLQKAVDWSQTDSDAMVRLGMAYNGVGRFEEAVTMFENAAKFVPNYTEAYEGMAVSFDALKENDLSVYARGMVAFSKKDYKTALDMLLKAVQAKPDFIPIYDGLGLTYEARNDLKNAKASYETAVKLFPDDFTAKTGLQRVNALLNK